MSAVQLLTRSGTRAHRSAPAAHAVADRRDLLQAPMALVVAFAVAAPASILLAAVGAWGHPVFLLVVLCMAAFAVGRACDLAGSLLVGPVFWLFFDGFDTHRWGVLGWDGRTDAVRLGLLVAAGALGALAGRLRAGRYPAAAEGALSSPASSGR
ncbi:hypothetical protein ACEZDB_05170 [Streptacidiphilus sp. N1-3]|uniref:Histidine kinase n=1 Tax=Streptacidiphilus alkalitolerans TaxID=3342712 RepID=A0ABV6WVJ6_9ACTN